MSRREWNGDGDHPEELLSLYVDGELGETERRRVQAHVDDCRRCQELVDDLTALTERAARLPDRDPEGDLWPTIAEQIGASAEAGAADPASGRGAGEREAAPDRGGIPLLRRNWRVSAAQLAAAAALVAALASGVTWTLTRGEADAPTRVAVTDTGSRDTTFVAWGSSTRLASLEEVPASVDTLERRYRDARDELDPETRRRLDEQLRLIDRVLEEARQELREHPDNGYLQQHLTRVVRRKAEFLAMAVQMTPET